MQKRQTWAGEGVHSPLSPKVSKVIPLDIQTAKYTHTHTHVKKPFKYAIAQFQKHTIYNHTGKAS